MTDELKPCPFCGEMPEEYAEKDRYGCEEAYGYWHDCKVLGTDIYILGSWPDATGAANTWNTRAERTCKMEFRKSGPFYDVYYFPCCDKEWSEPRCDDHCTELPGTVCPWCGAKVVE